MQTSGIVYIVDDDPGMRDALTRLLDEVKIECCSYETAGEFLEEFDPALPGCLVVDVRLPDMSGLELHALLIERRITVPVIVMTGHADVPMAVEALQRGALDFLEKPFRPQAMLDRVRRALELDRDSHEQAREAEVLRDRFASLTERERAVVDQVVAGLTNKQIAAKRGVSAQAIDACRARAMAKLKVCTVPHLVRVALQLGGGQP